jgi:hypothetical protein
LETGARSAHNKRNIAEIADGIGAKGQILVRAQRAAF